MIQAVSTNGLETQEWQEGVGRRGQNATLGLFLPTLWDSLAGKTVHLTDLHNPHHKHPPPKSSVSDQRTWTPSPFPVQNCTNAEVLKSFLVCMFSFSQQAQYHRLCGEDCGSVEEHLFHIHRRLQIPAMLQSGGASGGGKERPPPCLRPWRASVLETQECGDMADQRSDLAQDSLTLQMEKSKSPTTP